MTAEDERDGLRVPVDEVRRFPMFTGLRTPY